MNNDKCASAQTEHSKQIKKLQHKFDTVNNELHTLTKAHEALNKVHEELQDELNGVSQAHVQSSHHLSRMEADLKQAQAERDGCKVQLMAAGKEAQTYHAQYLALFKQHQAANDALQASNNEKELLKIQLTDANNGGIVANQSSQKSVNPKKARSSPVPVKSLNAQGAQMVPMGVAKVPVLPKSSTPKSAVRQQINLEEPFHPEHHALLASSSTPGSNNVANRGVAAPVAAAPPHKVVHEHELIQEDVMEAPKHQQAVQQQHALQHDSGFQNYFHLPQQQQVFHQGSNDDYPTGDETGYHAAVNNLNNLHHNQQQVLRAPAQHHFAHPDAVRFQRREAEHNLDRQVDHVQQDRPELRGIPAPMAGKQPEAEDEDEEDDEVDGQIRYHEEVPMARHLPLEEEEEGEELGDDDMIFRGLNNKVAHPYQPGDFGVRHVNFEPNQMFVGRPGGGGNVRFVQEQNNDIMGMSAFRRMRDI